MSFEELLLKVARVLENLKIDYCITGGYAVSVWGRPRATFDIDVVIQMETDKAELLAKELKALSRAGYIEETSIKQAIWRGDEFNFIHPESGIKVDFWVIKLTDPIGINELKRKVCEKIDGRKVCFISPEDLILSKLRWYKKSESERHLDDAKSIVSIQGNKLDKTYLKRWAAKQSTSKILEKLLTIL